MRLDGLTVTKEEGNLTDESEYISVSNVSTKATSSSISSDITPEFTVKKLTNSVVVIYFFFHQRFQLIYIGNGLKF